MHYSRRGGREIERASERGQKRDKPGGTRGTCSGGAAASGAMYHARAEIDEEEAREKLKRIQPRGERERVALFTRPRRKRERVRVARARAPGARARARESPVRG